MTAITPATRAWRMRAVSLIVAAGYLALTPAPPSNIDTGRDKLNHLLAFFTALASLAYLAFPAA